MIICVYYNTSAQENIFNEVDFVKTIGDVILDASIYDVKTQC